jgi:hypothetical protein
MRMITNTTYLCCFNASGGSISSQTFDRAVYGVFEGLSSVEFHKLEGTRRTREQEEQGNEKNKGTRRTREQEEQGNKQQQNNRTKNKEQRTEETEEPRIKNQELRGRKNREPRTKNREQQSRWLAGCTTEQRGERSRVEHVRVMHRLARLVPGVAQDQQHREGGDPDDQQRGRGGTGEKALGRRRPGCGRQGFEANRAEQQRDGQLFHRG